MSTVATPTFSLLEIQRAALIVLYSDLNETLEAMQPAWDAQDQEFASRLGRDFTQNVMEPIVEDNFHDGHRPSLIKAPITAYPNVSVMAFRATPTAESAQSDHQEIYRDLLWVELMVRSEVEAFTDTRAHRMAEAANVCLMREPTLEGLVYGHDAAPVLNLGDVFIRKENSKEGHGKEWFMRGARLEYAVRKESLHPATDTYTYSIDQG